MRLETLFFTGIVASILPVFAEAQHSHGGMSGMDQPQRQERKQEPAPKPTPGLLPEGRTRSARTASRFRTGQSKPLFRSGRPCRSPWS